MDVTIALLRRTVVEFPGNGEHLVLFKYERLPEFCQECGNMGHPSSVCDERLRIKGKLDSERPFPLSLRADMDLHGRRMGPRVGQGRFDGSLDGDGSDSQSWSRNTDGRGCLGIRRGNVTAGRPTQDTASSPVKHGVPKTKSLGVVIAERFAVQQTLLQLEKVMNEMVKLANMDEDVKMESLGGVSPANVDVVGAAVQYGN